MGPFEPCSRYNSGRGLWLPSRKTIGSVSRSSSSSSSWREWLRRIEPRLGFGFAVAVAIAFGAHQYRLVQTARAHDQIERVQLARELRVVSQEIASVPSPELFTDFDAINQIRQVSSVSDDELLKVLQ